MKSIRLTDDRTYVTAGQFVILLLVSRLSLTLLFCRELSGSSGLWDFFLPLLAGIPALLLLLFPLLRFLRKEPRLSVCEYAVQNMGRTGKVIPALYGIYFFFSAVSVLLTLRHFLQAILTEELPAELILVLLCAGVVYASCKGVEAVTRMSGLILAALVLLGILLAAFLSPNFSAGKLTPLSGLSLPRLGRSFFVLMGRMNIAAVLCILSSSIRQRPDRSLTRWSIWVSVIWLFLLLLSQGCAGAYLLTREFPVYQMTEVSGVLQRWKPFLIFVIISSVFCCLTVFLLSLSRSAALLIPKLSEKKASIFGGLALAGSIPLLSVPAVQRFLNSPYVSFAAVLIFLTFLPLTAAVHRHAAHSSPISRGKRRMIRTASLTLILTLSLVMLTGCSRQLNQSLIVQGIGIDRIDGRYRLTYIVLDTDHHEKENQTVLLRSEGGSMAESLSALEQQRGKKIVLSQCLFLMLNRSAASAAEQTLRVFAQTEDCNKTANLMVSDGTASDTITKAAKEFGYTAENINVIADSKEIRQPEIHYSLAEWITARAEGEETALFPYVKADERDHSLPVSGSFLTDGRGTECRLGGEETLGVLTLREQITDYVDTVQKDDISRELFIEKIDSVMTPVLKNNALSLQIRMTILLSGACDAETQRLAEEKYRQAVQRCLDITLRENACDVFSLSRSLQSAYPDRSFSREELNRLFRGASAEQSVEIAVKNNSFTE